MFKLRRSTAIAAVSLVAVLGTAGTAFAYWTITGSGSGTATVAEVKPLVIEPVAILGMVLNEPVALEGTMSNPNAFDVSVAGSSFSVTGAIDPAHSRCVFADNFELVLPTAGAMSVLANGTAAFAGGSLTLVDRPSVDQQSCQGATVTLAYWLE